MGHKVRKISTEIKTFFKNFSSPNYIILAQLRNNWGKIVGEKVASHSIPVALKDKKLIINVNDSIWLQELSLQSDEIKNNIHSFLKRNFLESIHLKFGEVKKVKSRGKNSEEVEPELPLEIEKLIEEKVSRIEDPKLREAFKHYFKVISIEEQQ